MNTQTMYDAVGYCRLSDEDGRATESRSIETQRDIIRRYAKEKGWDIRQFYVDDGYSGTNFDRPAYREMKEAIERGEAKCVIVKDLSRFGRNAAKMTLELEHFNDNFGLRFISISEDIDAVNTNDYNEVFQIVLVLNEMYPRDCSKKIKASWHNGVSDGKFMFGTPPFGYQRGIQNPLCLEVDPAAAAYVKRIFSLFASGESMRQIAETLNCEGAPSPRAYYYQKVGRKNPNSESDTWGSNTIRQLLENEAYIGVLVQGKRRAVSYKNKKRKLVPSEEWYRTENAHEPLIDEFTWETVQRRRKDKCQTRRYKRENVGIFSSLLRCGDCGAALAHTFARDKPIYRCSHYNNNGKSACSPHSISEEILSKVVAEDIRQYATLAQEEREELIHSVCKQLQSSKSETTQILQVKKRKIQNQIELNQSATKSLFEDRAKGYVPDNIFQTQVKSFSEEYSSLKEELTQLNEKMHVRSSNEQNVQCWVERIEKLLDIKSVDRIIATELIESIYVHETKLSDGKRALNISIKYRFVGNLDATKKDIA